MLATLLVYTNILIHTLCNHNIKLFPCNSNRNSWVQSYFEALVKYRQTPYHLPQPHVTPNTVKIWRSVYLLLRSTSANPYICVSYCNILNPWLDTCKTANGEVGVASLYVSLNFVAYKLEVYTCQTLYCLFSDRWSCYTFTFTFTH